MAARDDLLSGLGFRFSPVALKPQAGSKSPGSRGGRLQAGDSSGGVDRAPPPPPSACPQKQVAFNLRERRPGASYGSPQTSQAEETGAGEQYAPTRGRQGAPAVGAAAPKTGGGSSHGLAHLKLASLRRRAAAPNGKPAAAAAAAAADPAASTAAADAPAAHAAPPAEQPADSQADRLLHDMEDLLAGCASEVLDEPQTSVPLPLHMQLGRPVLSVPPLPAISSVPAAGQRAGSLQEALPAVPGNAGQGEEQGGPAGGMDATQPSAAAGGAREASSEAATGGEPACEMVEDERAGPATLEEALHCLGLLAGQHVGAESAAEGGQQQASVGGIPMPSEPQWARLRAVQVAVAAKQQAVASAELAPLARRLRQVQRHLVFHNANIQRSRSRSPRRSTSPAAAAPPPPWLSGRASARDSKHRSSGSGSPGLQARPKVGRPTAEESELQVQLLGSLRDRLLLKLGLAALRAAASAARLRGQLLARAAGVAAADFCRRVLAGWHAEIVPSREQQEAGAALAAQQSLRRQQAQLAAWRQQAAHRVWQRQQLHAAQARLRRRLLAAAVLHWRCFCQQRLVDRLQAALAARWLAAWGRRRVFTAWRQWAARSSQLKASLLLGRRSGGNAGGGSASAALGPASQLDALAANAAAFVPVKAFVAEAVQQLAQLRQGLRFCVPGSSDGDASALAAAQACYCQEQPALPVGSVEALLALMPPARQQQHAPAGPALLPPPPAAMLGSSGTPASALPLAASFQPSSAGSGSPAASPRHVPAAAPDPGSPPPSYNPACYASPDRQQQQQLRSRGPAAHLDGTEVPAAVEAELLECQGQVERLRQELQELEQESAELKRQCSELEAAGKAGQQAGIQHREACAATAASKEAAAAAMQAAVEAHAAAAAECAGLERQLRHLQQQSQEAVAAAAGARAAMHAAAERQAAAGMGVQKWSKAVDGAARELSACHRSQQAPVVVKLKEARQQLERHQQEAEAARQQEAELQGAAKQAAQRAQQAQQAVLAAQERLLAAATERAAKQQELDAAMDSHEAAAVGAVAAQQDASNGEQQQRLLAAQQQAAAGRLSQAAQQVLRKQQEAVLLQQQVQLLQQRHRDAVAASLAAEQRRTHQERHRRGKLKRRLQAVVQEEGEAPLGSPSAVQQRRPPPYSTTGFGPGFGPGGPAADGWDGGFVAGSAAAGLAGADASHEAEAAVGQLVLQVAPAPVWSCDSSELGSFTADDPEPPPLTLDEAAARFRCQLLLRRSLHMLRLEADAARSALQLAGSHWQRRHQSAVFAAWRLHAAEAAEWLHVTSTALRRRWLFRQWRAAAAECRRERLAEAKADGFVRRRLLAAGMAAWRQHLRHERWRDAAHEAVVHLRMRNMLQSWRAWTRRRRQKAARLRSALSVYHRRLLGEALRHWLWLHRGKALLRRVFGTAVELWQEEVGVRLHERNHERLRAAWDAWQLAVLEAQALRRQAILWNAAAAFRERQLLLEGLQAFKQAVLDAREQRRLVRLRGLMFAEWRRLAALSARHFEYEAARRHRQRCLLRQSLAALRSAAEATAEQLAVFWLRWQVQAPLRRALLGWRWAVQAQHEQRILSGMADVHRERRLQRAGLDAFAANLQAGRAAALARGGGGDVGPTSSSIHWQQQQGLAASSGSGKLSAGHGPPLAAVSVSVSPSCGPPLQPRHASRHHTGGQGTTITITCGQLAGQLAGQEQVPPPGAAASPAAAVAVAGGCGGAANAGNAAAAAQGMLEAVTSWRAAADFWRQRHESYGQQQQALPAGAGKLPAIGPQTASTLAELRRRAG